MTKETFDAQAAAKAKEEFLAADNRTLAAAWNVFQFGTRMGNPPNAEVLAALDAEMKRRGIPHEIGKLTQSVAQGAQTRMVKKGR